MRVDRDARVRRRQQPRGHGAVGDVQIDDVGWPARQWIDKRLGHVRTEHIRGRSRQRQADGTRRRAGVVGIAGGSADAGRTVVLVEDIVDTGDTAFYLIEELKKQNPDKIYFASLLLKPKALRQKIKIDYLGFEVPNDFLVGYGLDYDGLGRNLQDIYTLI